MAAVHDQRLGSSDQRSGDPVEGVGVGAQSGRPRRGRARRWRPCGSASSSKSKSSKFCCIRSAFIDFGKTMSPRWTCQRSVDLGRRTTDERRRSRRWCRRRRPCPCAIGDHASVSTPCFWLAARTSSLAKNGCTSTWLTTGTTPVSSTMRSRWAGWKFETPMLRVLPASCASISARQVCTKSPSYWVGQRPVDEEQVDLLEAEPLQRGVDLAARVVGAVEGVVELGGDVEVVAVEAGAPDRLADARPRCRTSARCRCGGSRPRGPWPPWPRSRAAGPGRRRSRAGGWTCRHGAGCSEQSYMSLHVW